MADDNKRSVFKTCVDVAAAIFVIVLHLCPWWMYIASQFGPPPVGHAPIQILVLTADILPAAFGIVWLLFRIGHKWATFISRWRLHYISTIIFVVIPLFLMKMSSQ